MFSVLHKIKDEIIYLPAHQREEPFGLGSFTRLFSGSQDRTMDLSCLYVSGLGDGSR